MTPDPEMAAVQDVGESYHPPIHEGIGPHRFVDSEFEHGKGRCDRCGGGPLAEIHQQKADPLERIAAVFERQEFIVPANRTAEATESIAREMGLFLFEARRIASDVSARNPGPLWMWFLVTGAAAGWGLWLGYHLRP